MPYRDMPEARYQRDLQFKRLVDTLENLVRGAEYSPSEMREASLLACIHYERTTIRHRVIYVNADGEASLRL